MGWSGFGAVTILDLGRHKNKAPVRDKGGKGAKN